MIKPFDRTIRSFEWIQNHLLIVSWWTIIDGITITNQWLLTITDCSVDSRMLFIVPKFEIQMVIDADQDF